MKPANSILSGYGTTVFEVMSRLAIEHGSINLGQGFPDEDGPADVRRVAAEALESGPNQYPPMMGLPELRRAVAAHNKRFYGLDVDWQSQVMVTSGATEALADCLFGLIEPGDEAVLIEPLYDCYLPIVRRAGAVPRLVRVTPPDWRLDRGALHAAPDRTTSSHRPSHPSPPVRRGPGAGPADLPVVGRHGGRLAASPPLGQHDEEVAEVDEPAAVEILASALAAPRGQDREDGVHGYLPRQTAATMDSTATAG